LHNVSQEKTGAEFFRELVPSLFASNYAAAKTLAKALRVAEPARPVRVLDLAAGSGVWGIALAEESPHVRVTAVDWVEVIPVTRQMAGRCGVEDRFHFIGGDLFQADFGSDYSIAVLGHILHGFGEKDTSALIEKTARALAPGGTIAIAEWLVNEDRTGPPAPLTFAVNMLVMTEQGNTYSFEEISRWLQKAGCENARLLQAPGPSPLVLADKRR
jgi:ubiquinone/menaquinone biosynthesis C-methylase UbiE